ncbi:zinc finger (Ran-binding) family protein [Striga hermonthica]|uniref:Zinc finger (Ran-binding) family protein n=1 Tax=Striga hermonthica TaxID=68872 RepID=A0A9N7MZZ0_STRHE|nr:zinc finger (Ran-binding) family protein [Striga hermonthica]
MAPSHLLLRRLKYSKPLSLYPLSRFPTSAVGLSTAADSATQSAPAAKPPSLSARMSFIFDQIDEIDRKREEKDESLQRIRAWRESKKQQEGSVGKTTAEDLKAELEKSEALLSDRGGAKREVELVHPWPEWVELMERLVQQNYFDHRRKDEDGMMEGLGFDVPEATTEEDNRRLDFTRNFKTVQSAIVNFGRDRFDILRSLSRQDLQILVGYGCPSADKKVSYSGKLLRKHVHLDEGDVCSSCSLRSSCEKAYLLTNKEDEARTIDVMRILLAYGFDAIDGSVANKPLLKMKSVKAVVRKLIHDVVKLSAVPIDPNLPPPVIKKPPPKVKQPPPPPKKRIGRRDVEMKKGDWLCPKCEFLNFAKNTVCLQCDAKRPKRQLLPGEWECPQCNFLNYRRNTACFHCEHKRPPDTYAENQFVESDHLGPRTKTDHRLPNRREDVSNAWNFDFDDNESDGADVATFEYADSQKIDEDFQLGSRAPPKAFDREYHPDSGTGRSGTGFNDFDDEDDDIDNYEVVSQNDAHRTTPKIDFSELEADYESEDVETREENDNRRGPSRGKKQMQRRKTSFTDSEDVGVGFDTDDDLPVHPDWKSSHVSNQRRGRGERRPLTFVSDDVNDDDDDDDLGFGSDADDETLRSTKRVSGRGSSDGMNIRRGGRSGFRGQFSESGPDDDDDDDLGFGSGANNKTLRSIKRGNRRGGSNGTNSRRGGRSGFRGKFSESGSDDDDDDDDDHDVNIRSRKRVSGRGSSNGMDSRRGGRSGFRGKFSESESDDEPSYRRNNQRDKAGRGGGMAFRKGSPKRDFDSNPRRNNRGGSRENSFNDQSRNFRDGNSSRKFQSRGKQGNKSFNKHGGGGGRSNYPSDSCLNDERHLRPRVNVR